MHPAFLPPCSSLSNLSTPLPSPSLPNHSLRPPNRRHRPPSAILRRASLQSSSPPPPPPPSDASETSPPADAAQQAFPDASPSPADGEPCVQCAGTASIACPVCGATGYATMTMLDTVSAAQCRLCRGKCAVPCPTCRAHIYKSVLWWDEEGADDDELPEGRIRWGGPPV